MKLLVTSLFLTLTSAVPALAHDNGEGLAGETTDKLITFFSLGVVLFFTLLVILGSTVQHLLDKRKEERKAARLRQRTGW